MISINSKEELKRLAKDLGVRGDWHEPDEQGVTANVIGKILNAGFYGLNCSLPNKNQELCVVLYQDKKPVAEIDLATLLAFACDTYEGCL